MPDPTRVRYALKLTTPPTNQVVTPDEAALHLRIDTTDYDFGLVDPMTRAATELAQAFTRRQFLTATYTLTMDQFPSVIRLPRPPLQSVTSVSYLDGSGVSQTLTANTDYVVDTQSEPGRIAPAYSTVWPVTYPQINAVTIVYVAGWQKVGDVPEAIKAAVRLMLGDLYQQRETVADMSIEEFPTAKALLWTQVVQWESVGTDPDDVQLSWRQAWLS